MRRLAGKLREVGPTYAVALLAQRLVPSRLVHVSRTQILEIAPRSVEQTRGEGARRATPDQVGLLAGFGHPEERIRSRLGGGDRAYLIERDGALVASVWFRERHYADAARRLGFRMAPDEIWLYDAMVAPARRGAGIYRELLAGAARDLGEHGFRRILVAVDCLNRNSVRAHVAAGAVPLVRLSIGRLGSWMCLSDGARRRRRRLLAGQLWEISSDALRAGGAPRPPGS